MSTDTTQTTSSAGEAGTTAGTAAGSATSFTPEQEAAVARIVAESVAKALQSQAGAAAADGANAAAGEDDTVADDPSKALQARLEAVEAQSKKVQEQAKRAVLQRHLPNLVSGELLKLAPAVELTEDGDLTADSARKLEAWKLANPYYFKAAAAGTTAQPGSNGSSRGAPSAETQARLRQAGVEPDAWKKKPGARIAMAMTGGVK